MKFRSFSFFSVAIHALILFPTLSNLSAQTQNNLVSTTPKQETISGAAGTAASNTAPKQADTTGPIDSMVIKTYSEQQLNDLFDQMTSHYSKDAVLFNNIGATYFGLKIYDKAENAIRRAVVLNNHPAFLTNLSILYDQQGRINEAITMAQRAVSQAPKYVRARTLLCGLMITSKRDADAILCYDETSKITTLDALDQTYYAVALFRSKNFDKAISVLTPLIKSEQPTSLMFNTLGNAYYMKKRYTQAADALKRAVEIEPDSAMLRYNLALCLTATNNRAGALSQYSLMKQEDPALADQLYKYLYRDKIVFVDQQTASKDPKKK